MYQSIWNWIQKYKPKKIFERAKAAGINISAMTEELLKSVTYEPKGKSQDDVVIAYEKLFEYMGPLVIKYDLLVKVGEYRKAQEIHNVHLGVEPYDQRSTILYDQHTDIKGNHTDHCHTDVREQFHCLYKPKTILENLILELLGNVEKKNKQKIRELELASRFVDVLLSEIESV